MPRRKAGNARLIDARCTRSRDDNGGPGSTAVMRASASSLSSQLAWRFAAVALLASIGLASVLAWMLASGVETREGDGLRSAARATARALAADVGRQARNVRALANSPALWHDGLDSTLVLETLARVQAVDPEDSWIGVADADGVVRAATHGLLVGVNVRSRPWFGPGLRAPGIGELHEARLLAAYLPAPQGKEPARFVDFSAPIRAGDRTLGVVAIHGSWSWADEVVRRSAPLQANAAPLETFIFDRQGKLIYAPGGLVAPFAGQRRPAIDAGAKAVLVPWADGREYLSAAFPVPTVEDGFDPGWVVVTRLRGDLERLAVRDVVVKALVCGLLAALVAALLGRRVALKITQPLHELSEAVRALTPGGVLPVPAGRGASIEVRRLADAMQAMTENLARSNRELESRVALRTAELKAVVAELEAMAHCDALTGLLNRRGLMERARIALATARRTSRFIGVALVDADHFKKINDSHGHEAGDHALRAIGGAIRQRARETDIVARWGGEEFLVLMPDTDLEGALVAARSLVAAVEALELPRVGRVTISCGVTTMSHEEAVETAVRRADEALYRAKSAGRNRAEFAPLTATA